MLRTDTRAQSIQIGAVLLFGVLIILLSTWQAFGIPNQNEGIEFNHNQKAQQQMTELRTTVTSMPDASVPRSVTLDLGVRYPSRTIFRNPPPAAGTVRTVDTGREAYAINITGSPVDENLAQLWNKTGTRYNTGAIKYSPQYSEYQNPPQTIYEHSVVYNKFEREDTTLSISGQSIIEGDQITLTFLNGSLSKSRVGSTSVDFEPTSTQTRTVVIEPKNGNVTLDIPTRLDVAEWRSLLNENHEVTPLANISGETDQFASNDDIQTIRIEVDANREEGLRESYRLQLAKVGIGTEVTGTEKAYITDIEGDNLQLRDDETRAVTVEVRDPYNGPVRGVRVNASAAHDADFADGTRRTDSEGQVTFQYSPDGTYANDQTDQLNFTIQDGYDPQSGTSHEVGTPTNLTMDVSVQGTDINDGTGGGGPVDLEWIGPGLSAESDDYTFEFNLTAGDSNQEDFTVQTVPAGVDQFDVDFAANAPSISLTPQNTTTNTQGNSTVTLTADTNQTIALYAVGGSGGDVVNVTVINTTSGTTAPVDSQTLQQVESEGVGDGMKLVFDVKNVGSSTVTAVNFSVDATTGGSSRIDNGADAELTIGGTTAANRDGPGRGNSGFKAQGDTYEFTSNGGQDIDIPSGGQVTIDIREFDFGNVEYADSADSADITVTIGLSDGTVQEFYFNEV